MSVDESGTESHERCIQLLKWNVLSWGWGELSAGGIPKIQSLSSALFDSITIQE